MPYMQRRDLEAEIQRPPSQACGGDSVTASCDRCHGRCVIDAADVAAMYRVRNALDHARGSLSEILERIDIDVTSGEEIEYK